MAKEKADCPASHFLPVTAIKWIQKIIVHLYNAIKLIAYGMSLGPTN